MKNLRKKLKNYLDKSTPEQLRADLEKIENKNTKLLLETILKTQGDLLYQQGILIDQLTKERDGAINNLKTASEQWKQWRKETI